MKENQRVSLTKRLLKDALLRLLEEKELDKISISELCRESEINRATFYRHYKLPKDVLIDIEKDFIREIYAMTSGIKSEADAEKYLEHLCLYFYERSALVKCFMDNNIDYDIERLTSDFYQNILRFGSKLCEEKSDADREIISTYLSGGAYLILRRWINGKIKKTPEEISRITLKLFNGDYDL